MFKRNKHIDETPEERKARKKMKRKKRLKIGGVLLVIFVVLGAANSAEKKRAAASPFKIKDDFLAGYCGISYTKAKIGYPLMNMVFNAANKKAEGTEKWSEKDGMAYLDFKYGEYKQNQYNMYIPKGLDRTKPQGVVLCIHGGQWIMGDKDSMDWLAQRMAKAGYIGVTMGYSLNSLGNDKLAKATGSMPDANAFTMLNDISACVKAVKAQCKAFGYKVDSLALTGQSAGSHLAMLYAYSRAEESAIPVKMIFVATTPVTVYYDAFSDLYKTPQAFTDVVKALLNDPNITVEQVTEQNELIDSVSPVTFIDENTVPTLMAFAGDDHTVGLKMFPTIEPILQENNVPYDVIWYENSDHTLDKDKGKTKEFTDKAIEWLNEYMH